MENTFLLDFSNTLGGFMTGISDSTDLFIAAVIILGTVGIVIAVSNRRRKSPV